MGDHRSSSASSHRVLRRRPYWLRTNCKSFADGLYDVDVITTLADTKNPKYYRLDGVHLTPAGYELTADEIAKVIQAVAKGDKNSVTLRVNPDFAKSLANCPETVEIPVNKKGVAGLVFLHTGGWTPGATTYAWREIRYADGSKVSMGLNSMNFADWNYGHDNFPDEEGTTTTVVWRGSCGQYPITRVYRTLWVNPHPDKKIDKIVITDAGLITDQQRFVAHLAITLAMSQGAAAAGGDDGTNDMLVSDVLRLNEFQVWFINEQMAGAGIADKDEEAARSLVGSHT